MAIRLAATVAALALVTGGSYGLTRQRHGVIRPGPVRTRYLSAMPGAKILSVTAAGYMTLSDLRDGHASMVRSLGQMAMPPVASLDGRYLATPYGQVVALTGSVGRASTRLSLTEYQQSAPVEPLAGRDRYWVVLGSIEGFAGTDDPVSVLSLSTGRSVRLGRGDNIAGDPLRAGAFVSAPAPIHPSAQPNRSLPDSRVELRDIGRPAIVLATAAQLNSELRLPGNAQVALFPCPDPTGGKVAIMVEPTTSDVPGGVVVMTRTGHVVQTISGTRRMSPLSWSRSGQSLAFATSGAQSAVHLWNAVAGTRSLNLPGGQYGTCVWSPDAAWILCPAGGVGSSGTNGAGAGWYLASAAGSAVVQTAGHGSPVAWLGGSR